MNFRQSPWPLIIYVFVATCFPARATPQFQDSIGQPTPNSWDQSGPQSGSSIPPPSAAQTKISVTTNLVVLPVTVKDAAGNLVPDLQENEFQVLDDGVPQALTVFTQEAFPLSIVALIDDDLKNSEAQQVSASLKAVTGGLSVSDELLVCRFDVGFYPAEGFASNLDVLFDELSVVAKKSEPSKTAAAPPINNGPAINGHPDTNNGPSLQVPNISHHRPSKALDDAIFASAQLLQTRPSSQRKLLLVISDGENNPALNHHTYEEALGELLKNNVSVFSLAIGSTSAARRFARLRQYADQTGGDVFFATKSDAIEKLYSMITEEARHEYTLAYVPQGNNSASSYHVVEVSTTRPGLRVKTRQGYYSTAKP